jgi:hypothetical protein
MPTVVAKLPETWTRLGFQLVPTDAADVTAAPHALEPVSGEHSVPH